MPHNSVHCLSTHADYACQRTGACCTAGWTIPIDAVRHRRLDRGLADGQVRPAGTFDGPALVVEPELPDEAAAVLAQHANGACVFFDTADRGLCSVQRGLGHDALPVACQEFPRVSLTDARGVFLTLSHYCPTAARMLFRDEVPLRVVTRLADRPYEGLDARGALPPLLTARVLMDWESYDRWERFIVQSMDEDREVEDALLRIIEVTERIRAWVPGERSLTETIERAIAAPSTEAYHTSGGTERRIEAMTRFHDCIVATIPAGLPRPEVPESFGGNLAAAIAPAWYEFRKPISRYLAAKGFASWFAYQGRGLRTIVAGMIAALVELQVEAARVVSQTGRPLDADGLLAAIRAADLTMLHLASRLDLARTLSTFEDLPLSALLEPLL